jgi:DNA-binding CsgD family transcriptional regulator
VSTPRPDIRATDREVSVLAAVVATGSEKAAAHRLGLSHSTVKHHFAKARSKVWATTTAQLVWILAPRLPAPLGEKSKTATRGPAGERVPARPSLSAVTRPTRAQGRRLEDWTALGRSVGCCRED